MTEPHDPSRWEIDKRIPIIPALLLFGQIGSFIWFGAKLDGRVSQLEKQADGAGSMMERVIKIEAAQGTLSKQLDKISDQLDKRLEKR